jgi:hypothetical protein
MEVYQTDTEGFYVGPTLADQDPLDEANWLIPGGCVEQEPPALSEGQRARFTDGAWLVVDPALEADPEAEPELPPTKEQQEQLRRWAYQQEADPLFFMSQRGEATVEEWQAKVQEIKARYPYPEEA